MCECIRVCVSERYTNRGREKESERVREKERERHCKSADNMCVCETASVGTHKR